jgi:hypothetical protein
MPREKEKAGSRKDMTWKKIGVMRQAGLRKEEETRRRSALNVLTTEAATGKTIYTKDKVYST